MKSVYIYEILTINLKSFIGGLAYGIFWKALNLTLFLKENSNLPFKVPLGIVIKTSTAF